MLEGGIAVKHIGDSYEDDIQGARGAGIEGILIDHSGRGRAFENVKMIDKLTVLIQ